ncbi:MAG: hypothetical protein JSS22_04125 [Proteobacteria bacterium]|nr:hypothetical protein [Pseudomonadota bacterium]
MTIPVHMEIQANSYTVRGPALSQALPIPTTANRKLEIPAGLSTADLAFGVFAAFRAHPHVCNVLTHISRSNWNHVESVLNAILDPATTSDGLSPLPHNILDLMCAERGVTGRTLKPYFHAVLHRLLGPTAAERTIDHVETLRAGIERKAEYPTDTSRTAATGDKA